jgi:alginate O-acetyltransferase complex protein AlgI
MGKDRSRRQKTPYLLIAVFADVGTLLFFKYFDFFSRSMSVVLRQINISGALPELGLLVPLGISFYTLQTLSYLFDVYRGEMEPERNPAYLALYVAFFPTLLSGPIERGKHLLPQLHKVHDFSYERSVEGLQLVAWGVFKKVVVADRIAIYVNAVYGNLRDYTGFPLLLATFLFAIQLYYDFSGYTDIARGVAKILGYDILINFNLPYLSRSIGEFWRRWHISMTSWFRDYVYIPLGGNRVSHARTYLNIVIVFLLSGLWHGAAGTFLIWGCLHGFYMVVSRATEGVRGRVTARLSIDPGSRFAILYRTVFTFCLVDFAWIFFRAGTFANAQYVITNMFRFANGPSGIGKLVSLPTGSNGKEFIICLVLIALMFVLEVAQSRRPLRQRLNGEPVLVRWLAYVGLVTAVLLFGVIGSPQFFYVRF